MIYDSDGELVIVMYLFVFYLHVCFAIHDSFEIYFSDYN